MSFAIRPASPDQYAAVGDLTAAAYAADGLVPPGSDYADTLRDAASRAEKAILIVALSDTELLGTVTYCPVSSPYREIGANDEGEFRMLAVSPAARGMGVGTALTRHCIDRSRALGMKAVVLSSSPRMTAAHRLYESLGFTRLPDRDWSPVAGLTLLAFGLTLS